MSNEILLMFSPFWEPYTPFSALPCLVAQLKKEGFHVHQFDLNIEHFNHFMSYYKINSLDNAVIDATQYRNLFNELDLSDVNKLDKELIGAYRKDIYVRDGIFIFSKEREELNLKKIVDNLRNEEELVNTFVKSDAYQHIEQHPPLVGFSITSLDQLGATFLYCKMVREKSPETKIVLGGSYISYLINYMEKDKLKNIFEFCDFVVVGEGETAITLLSELCINGTGHLNEIPNLCFMPNGDELVMTSARLEDVEQLSPPDYEDVDFSLYLMPEKMVAYQTSRGCFWGKCAFCNHDEAYRKNYRKKSPLKVMSDLLQMKKIFCFDHIQFVDEAIEPSHLEDIVNEMDRCEHFKNIKWLAYLKISSKYREEIIAKARKNGCEMVFFGVETFNKRLSMMVKKGIDVDVIEDVLRLFKKNGIKVHIWMMAGLPSQTAEEHYEDIERLKNLSGFMDGLALSPFHLDKTTEMYNHPEKFNIIGIDEANNLFSSHKDGKILNTSEISSIMKNDYGMLVQAIRKSHNRYIIYFRHFERI